MNGFKISLLIALLFAAACGCPQSGSNVKSDFTVERDAACAAVEGCDPEFMASVPVYLVEDVRETNLCESDRAVGCFCENFACQSVLVNAHPVALETAECKANFAAERCLETVSMIMLHEYVHAAYASVGDNTHDHPARFWTTLKAAWKSMPKSN